MTKLITGIAALSLGLVPGALAAQMPPVHVYGGEDRDRHIRCEARYSDAIAAAEAVLRNNDVVVASWEDYEAKRALGLFLNLNVADWSDAAGTFSGNCSASLDLSLRAPETVTDPVLGQRHMVAIVYCERGSLMGWPASEMRARLDQEVRSWVASASPDYRLALRD